MFLNITRYAFFQDKTLIFVACCLSAVYAQFPAICELECVSSYIGDIAECRIEFPFRPGMPNKDLQVCLMEVEHDRNVCMVMNIDPICKQLAPRATLHKTFEMNLNQPAPTTTTTMPTTTTTTPPPAAPVQVGPALSQPSQSQNKLIQLYVDPSNSPSPYYQHHGLVGKPSSAFFSPVAMEPMPMQAPAGLTAAQTARHNRIQNMIQRKFPQNNPRPSPHQRQVTSMQLPGQPRTMPKQMQLPGQQPATQMQLPGKRPTVHGPQPNVAQRPQQQKQPQSVVRTNPKIIQRRLTVFKLAKPFKPSPINMPVQPSFSAPRFNYLG